MQSHGTKFGLPVREPERLIDGNRRGGRRNRAVNEDVKQTLMRRAIELSARTMRQGKGGPFGAIVARDGEVIAEGWNRVTSTNDPTAHAEVTAIRAAAARLGRFSLAGCDLYTSCEPCPMCLAAAYWARVDHVYYANTRDDAARIGFDDSTIYGEIGKPPASQRLPLQRLLGDEAVKVFDEWVAKPDKVMY